MLRNLLDAALRAAGLVQLPGKLLQKLLGQVPLAWGLQWALVVRHLYRPLSCHLLHLQDSESMH